MQSVDCRAWCFLFAFFALLGNPVYAQSPTPPPETNRVIPREGVPIIEQETVLMGTEVSILIQSEDRAKAQAAIAAGFGEIKRIEDLMTDWRESLLEEVNRAAGKQKIKVTPELTFLLQESYKVSEVTHGAFDISYAGVGKLWDFYGPNPQIPAAEAIQKALPLVNYKNVVVDAKKNTVFLKKEGMRIGLGGIAKGYAVDRARKVIKTLGVENFAVKAGGDLFVEGHREGRLWWIAIRDPDHQDKNVALLPISNGAVSTSGDYERFFMLNGKRYCHILDPKTGYPVDHARSVTIIANKSYWADGLATGVFVLGPEKGMALIESLEGVEGMIIDAQGKVTVSSGLQKNFEVSGTPRTL